jgi:hypothetical protein
VRRTSQSTTPITAGRRGGGRTGPALAELEALFARFRQELPRGSRVPADLRAAALAALREGVDPAVLHRRCGVSQKQLIAWKGGRRSTPAKAAAPESMDVRAFSVVDEPIREPTPGQELELRLGTWSISVRLVDPRAAERG